MFVTRLLGLSHPWGDVVVLLGRELSGTAVRHSGSGDPGETVAVWGEAGEWIAREVCGERIVSSPSVRLARYPARWAGGLRHLPRRAFRLAGVSPVAVGGVAVV